MKTWQEELKAQVDGLLKEDEERSEKDNALVDDMITFADGAQ